MASRIEDYAIIADCQSVALVGKDGSIDWLCLPSFDSDACFAALLGTEENGRFKIAPLADVRRVTRKYRGDTLILETRFETAEGVVDVIDLMPLRGTAADVVRVVVGISGRVRMRMELVIRFGYGTIVPWVQGRANGIEAVAGPDLLQLVTPIETRGENHKTVAEFTVAAGERVPFVLTWTPSHLPREQPVDPELAIKDTETFWQQWSSRCAYAGPYAAAVKRSLLTLKALTYAPTGGIAAAATTSLPERIGGVRNWDYRYCWIRDATFTLYALSTAGYIDEARAWRDWLLRAVAGDPAQIRIMYGLAGERRLTEIELPWLAGYEGSRPVRIGNAAHAQFQLDVFGELMDAFHVARRYGLKHESAGWALQQALMEFLERSWDKPDEGIWEVRGPRRHFTHSKVMAWVALDRAVKSVEQYQLEGPVDRWRALRSRIADDVFANGFDASLGSFVQSYGSKDLDASLLMLPLVGFLRADDPRAIGTVRAIESQLMDGGFVHRYRSKPGVDGLPAGEGVFLACSFWLADNYVLQGRRDDAERLFERLVGLTNDVGLLSEEYDVRGGRMLGNFPQAFSHVALVNTAQNLATEHGPAEDRGIASRR